MAHLSAGTNIPFVNFPIEDNTAAYSGPQGNHDGTFGALRGTSNHLAQCGTVGIIGKAHRHAQLLPELITQGNIFPAEIIGIDNQALCGAAVAWRADTDRNAILQGNSRLFYCFFYTASNIIDDIIQHPLRASLDRRARNDLFVLIDHADRYIGTTEINAYTIFHSYRPPLWGSAHSIAHFVGKWK